jgi:hypothetical protein
MFDSISRVSCQKGSNVRAKSRARGFQRSLKCRYPSEGALRGKNYCEVRLSPMPPSRHRHATIVIKISSRTLESISTSPPTTRVNVGGCGVLEQDPSGTFFITSRGPQTLLEPLGHLRVSHRDVIAGESHGYCFYWDRACHRIAFAWNDTRNFKRRNAGQADRQRRPAFHAIAFCSPSNTVVSVAIAPRSRRVLGRRPLERRVSRRVAASRCV